MKKKVETKKSKEAKLIKPVVPAVVEGAELVKKARTPELLRGMRDILPQEQGYWRLVFDKVRSLADIYGFEKIDTPLLEEAVLFSKTIGRDTDIVEKEMYAFDDLDGTKVVLRPEATASIARAYLNHGMFNLPQPVKLWYWGPMFRHERPQAGRYRQFHQFGFEIIGEASPLSDALMILIAYNFYHELGVPVAIQINSLGCLECRGLYRESLLQYYRGRRGAICENCKRRLQRNPLRVLDCKVPADQALIEALPRMTDFLCDACRQHQARLEEHLHDRGIAFTPAPRMVRGLDYYTRTTFEFVHGALGAQNSVLGGGRYDGLSEMLGGPRAPGIGFSIGEDRLVYLLTESGVAAPAHKLDVYVAWLGDGAFRHASGLARDLRSRGHVVELQPEALKLRRALEIAAKQGARFTLIVGENEVASRRYPLKDLARGEQKELSWEEVLAALKPPAATRT